MNRLPIHANVRRNLFFAEEKSATAPRTGDVTKAMSVAAPTMIAHSVSAATVVPPITMPPGGTTTSAKYRGRRPTATVVT